jgi:hypothetical protein
MGEPQLLLFTRRPQGILFKSQWYAHTMESES